MNHLRDSKHMNYSMITTSEHVDKLHFPRGSHPSEKAQHKGGKYGLAIKQSVFRSKRPVESLSSLNPFYN